VQTLTRGTRGVNDPTGHSHQVRGRCLITDSLPPMRFSARVMALTCSPCHPASARGEGGGAELACSRRWWHGDAAQWCTGHLWLATVWLSSAQASRLRRDPTALERKTRKALERLDHDGAFTVALQRGTHGSREGNVASPGLCWLSEEVTGVEEDTGELRM
jgi:hypothetical protein